MNDLENQQRSLVTIDGVQKKVGKNQGDKPATKPTTPNTGIASELPDSVGAKLRRATSRTSLAEPPSEHRPKVQRTLHILRRERPAGLRNSGDGQRQLEDQRLQQLLTDSDVGSVGDNVSDIEPVTVNEPEPIATPTTQPTTPAEQPKIVADTKDQGVLDKLTRRQVAEIRESFAPNIALSTHEEEGPEETKEKIQMPPHFRWVTDLPRHVLVSYYLNTDEKFLDMSEGSPNGSSNRSKLFLLCDLIEGKVVVNDQTSLEQLVEMEDRINDNIRGFYGIRPGKEKYRKAVDLLLRYHREGQYKFLTIAELADSSPDELLTAIETIIKGFEDCFTDINERKVKYIKRPNLTPDQVDKPYGKSRHVDNEYVAYVLAHIGVQEIASEEEKTYLQQVAEAKDPVPRFNALLKVTEEGWIHGNQGLFPPTFSILGDDFPAYQEFSQWLSTLRPLIEEEDKFSADLSTVAGVFGESPVTPRRTGMDLSTLAMPAYKQIFVYRGSTDPGIINRSRKEFIRQLKGEYAEARGRLNGSVDRFRMMAILYARDVAMGVVSDYSDRHFYSNLISWMRENNGRGLSKYYAQKAGLLDWSGIPREDYDNYRYTENKERIFKKMPGSEVIVELSQFISFLLEYVSSNFNEMGEEFIRLSKLANPKFDLDHPNKQKSFIKLLIQALIDEGVLVKDRSKKKHYDNTPYYYLSSEKPGFATLEYLIDLLKIDEADVPEALEVLNSCIFTSPMHRLQSHKKVPGYIVDFDNYRNHLRECLGTPEVGDDEILFASLYFMPPGVSPCVSEIEALEKDGKVRRRTVARYNQRLWQNDESHPVVVITELSKLTHRVGYFDSQATSSKAVLSEFGRQSIYKSGSNHDSSLDHVDQEAESSEIVESNFEEEIPAIEIWQDFLRSYLAILITQILSIKPESDRDITNSSEHQDLETYGVYEKTNGVLLTARMKVARKIYDVIQRIDDLLDPRRSDTDRNLSWSDLDGGLKEIEEAYFVFENEIVVENQEEKPDLNTLGLPEPQFVRTDSPSDMFGGVGGQSIWRSERQPLPPLKNITETIKRGLRFTDLRRGLQRVFVPDTTEAPNNTNPNLDSLTIDQLRELQELLERNPEINVDDNLLSEVRRIMDQKLN